MPDVIDDFVSTIRRWHVWALMANQDIRLRYKRSVIGPFWISITMATFVFGIGLLYAEILNQPFREYLLYFGCGMLVWTLISGLVLEGAGAVLENESHLRSIPLPVPMLVARSTYRNLLVFGHNALVIFGMMVLFGHMPTLQTLYAVAGLLICLVAGYLLGIILAPLCTRFRDIAQVLANVMQLFFFLTPIFWTADAAGSRPLVVEANPFYHFIQLVRAPVLNQEWTALNIQVTGAVTIALFVGALVTLATTRKQVYVWL